MAHTCHATGCKFAVPREMFMCKRHWFTLPKKLRDRIWATYREGQCDDMRPSEAYCHAARDSVIWLADREQRSPDTALYDHFLAKPAARKEEKDCADCLKECEG